LLEIELKALREYLDKNIIYRKNPAFKMPAVGYQSLLFPNHTKATYGYSLVTSIVGGARPSPIY
jgi:hypothetical protein